MVSIKETEISKSARYVALVSGIMLLLAIPSIWPYGFYQILRLVVSISGVFSALQVYKLGKVGWVWVMFVVAILFNPIAPIFLSKQMWVVIDFVASISFFLIARELKNR